MTTLANLIEKLHLEILTKEIDFSQIQVTDGYTSDLLSCVMAGAPNQSVWVTLQAHNNIIAVASLLELSAIIISEGAMPDQSTIDKANEEGIPLLRTQNNSFQTVGMLWDLGIRSEK
jgi:serine kinase of HPr protein (carbohydrate metabolism regulator)